MANTPPLRPTASGHVTDIEHDVLTCPACAEVLSRADRDFIAHPERWVEVADGRPRQRRYRKKRPSVVLSVRFDADEYALIATAAEREGTYTSAYVRDTLLRCMRAVGETP